MENSPGRIFALMEDDLAGHYAKEGDPPALVSGGALAMAGTAFGEIALCPLIMDFDNRGLAKSDAYYYKPPEASIDAQIRDIMLGIRDYRVLRPKGMLRIHPFLGVNPKNHSAESLASFLEGHLGTWHPGAASANERFFAMDGYSAGEEMAGRRDGRGLCLFSGVKLYPPLGFDPWPEAGEEREKVETLFGFCEKRGIPVTTHCDDHGFRVISMDDAFTFTSPFRYRPVLERFPGLKIDFAHFGRQYTSNLRLQAQRGWFDEIIRLIQLYPNVYTDFSFNGVEPEYYERLKLALDTLPVELREKVASRIMFGSDFVVNLMKVRSYAEYFRIFDESSLDAGLRLRFCSGNPERFLFG